MRKHHEKVIDQLYAMSWSVCLWITTPAEYIKYKTGLQVQYILRVDI